MEKISKSFFKRKPSKERSMENDFYKVKRIRESPGKNTPNKLLEEETRPF